MRNNKLTRKRAERQAARLAKASVTVQQDGTEVLHSKESRAKRRRWTYLAEVEMVIPQKAEDGTEKEPVKMPVRTLKLQAVTYSDARDAREETKHQEDTLRNTNQFFKMANIKVIAVPHETISNDTYQQLQGYRDMAMILDKALEGAIKEAQAMVSGKSFGVKFVEKEAVPPTMEGETLVAAAVPARTLAIIKEEFYKEAVDLLKKRMEEMNAQSAADSAESVPGAPATGTEEAITGSGLIVLDSSDEERRPFVPEIVEIGSKPVEVGELA